MSNTRIILSLLLSLACMMLFASCSGGGTQEVTFTELSGWTEYKIVRPDVADSETVDAAVLLRNTVEEKLSTRLSLESDWVKRGTEVPVGTKEILVGATNRPESAATELKYFDYVIEFVGDRVVINGGSGEAVMNGVNWFIENCLGETLMVPEKQYVCLADYPLAELTIGGIKLSDFAVADKELDPSYESCMALRSWIAENTGIAPKTEGEHEIIFKVDTEINMENIAFETKDGDLTISVSDIGYSTAQALDVFYEIINSRTGDAIELNEVKTMAMNNFSTTDAAYVAELEAKADKRREEIRNTPNMEIPAGSTVFYLSPKGNDANDGKTPATAWKTLAKLNASETPAGCYVCFERGGMWRGRVTVRAGVTYTAYGEGPKPEIRASSYDGAVTGKWEEVEKNIWRYSEKFTSDVGMLVMNHGEEHAYKILLHYDGATIKEVVGGRIWNGYTNLDENYEFFHDLGGKVTTNSDGGYIYMYCDKGNPAELWESIEFIERGSIFACGRKDNITIDNICIKYSNFGVSSGKDNLKVTNCEIGWIGGCIQGFSANGSAYRYGNGVEIYGSCVNFVCDNNYVYQCYDAGLTQQFSAAGSENVIMDGVYYTNNLIEDCVYSIEYFLGKPEAGEPTRYMTNFYIRDNIMIDAGYGFGSQRPDQTSPAHIKGWDHMNTLDGDFIIENNVFLRSWKMMIHSGCYEPEDAPVYRSNIFLQNKNGQWGRNGAVPTTLKMYNYDTVGAEEYAENTFYLINEPIVDPIDKYN